MLSTGILQVLLCYSVYAVFTLCYTAVFQCGPADWYLGIICFGRDCCPRNLRLTASMVICDVRRDAHSQ